jgi:hypothetical protein
VHSATVILRRLASCAQRRAASFLALAALACLVLVACSPGTDYPSLFPSVHDLPPPRTDTTLNSNQVQQATEDLISARDRLSTEAQTSTKPASTKPALTKPAAKSPANSQAISPADPAGKTLANKSSANNASAKPAAGATVAVKPQAIPVSAQQSPGTDAAQSAGTETK